MPEVLAADPHVFVHMLRVLLIPELAVDHNVHVGWLFDDGTRTGLHLRNCVAVPTKGNDAPHVIHLRLETWAQILAAKTKFNDAFASGAIRIVGDAQIVGKTLSCFDHPAFETA